MTAGVPPARRTPRFLRFGPWVAATMVCAWAGYHLALPRYVESCIQDELRAKGFEEASLRLRRVTFFALDLSDVRLDPSFRADEVRVRFDPLDLLAGQIGTVTVVGARWRTRLDTESLEGSAPVRLLAPEHSSDAGGGAVGRVRLVRSWVEVEGEEGVAPIAVEGEVACGAAGTEVTLRATQRRLATDLGGAEVVLRGARVEARAVLHGSELADLALRATADTVSVDDHAAGGLAASARFAGDRIAYRVDTTGGPLSLSAEGEIPSDPGAWSGPASWPVSWRAEGPLPSWLLPDLEPSAEATVSATCLATIERADGEALRLVVSEVDVVARSARLAPLGIDAELEGVHAELRARGEVSSEGVFFEVVEGSRVSATQARLEDGVAGPLEVTPAVRLEGGPEGFRLLARGATKVRVESLDVAGRVLLGPLDATVTPRDGAPLVEHTGDRTHVAARVHGKAGRLRGKVRGRDARIRAEVLAALGATGAFVSAPVEIDVARLAHPGSEVVLGGARVAVPLSFGAGAEAPVATVAARDLSWRGVRLCAATGEVHFGADAVRVDARCPFGGTAPATLAASLPLEGGGTLDVVVPESTIRADDPVARVLGDLTSLEVSGTVGGDVHLDLGSDEGRTRFAFREATVEGIDLGPGAAMLSFDGDGVVTFEDAVVELAGGRIAAAPFRIDPEQPELDLSLAVNGMKLRDVLRTVSDGRASGTGELDGRLAFRMRLEPRLGVEIGDSVLSARGKGRIRIGDASLRESVERSTRKMPYDEQLRRHVTGALTDFEYTDLSLTFTKAGRTSRLRASVQGRGKVVPQELSLRLDVNGVQEIVDEVLRLRPSGGLEIAFAEGGS